MKKINLILIIVFIILVISGLALDLLYNGDTINKTNIEEEDDIFIPKGGAGIIL